MSNPESELSDEQSRQVADLIREEIARRRMSRQALAEQAKLSLSTLEKALGRKAEKNMLPMQRGDVPATFADVEALTRDVGFKPATPIETGVQKFVEWYREFYKV